MGTKVLALREMQAGQGGCARSYADFVDEHALLSGTHNCVAIE